MSGVFAPKPRVPSRNKYLLRDRGVCLICRIDNSGRLLRPAAALSVEPTG